MAAPTAVTIFAGGSLILNPTDHTDPSTGTEAGTVQDCRVEIIERTSPVRAAEYGGEEVDADYLFSEVFLRFTIANWDQNAFAANLPGVTAGNSQPVVTIPSSGFAAGSSMKSRAVKLLWAPQHNGVSGAEDPGWLAISAYPERDFTRVIAFEDSKPSVLQCLYRCTRESGDLLLRLAALEDQS